MEEAADITVKKERGDEESSLTKVYDISKNPIFHFQEAIKAILNCLGFEFSKPESSSSSSSSSFSSMSDQKEEKEEEENSKEESSEQEKCVFQEEDGPEGKQISTNTNNENPTTTPSANDPPQPQTLIEAATRRGRTPPRPGVSRGSPPQNN